jgi:hypothetical protein
MSTTPHPDVALLRSALTAARDGMVLEADLDDSTIAAIRRWPLSLYGPAGSGYWLAADIENLLGGAK